MHTSLRALARFKLLAALALSLLALASSASAEIYPWSVASGKTKTPIGKKVAFYVWHVGNVVSLTTTGTTTKGYPDTGQFTLTGGTISKVTTSRLEKGDKVTLDSTKTILSFHFTTAKGTDGVSFTISGGTQLKLQVAHNGVQATNLVFIGKNATAVPADPVTFNLTD
jgi:hypothetical protein